MKKILFCTDSLIMGGQEKVSIDYLKMLLENSDYKISLLINEDNGKEGNIFINDIPKKIKYKFVIEKEIISQINKYRELKKGNVLYKILYNYYLGKRKKSYLKNIKKIIKQEEYDYLIDFTCQLPTELCDNRVISWIHTDVNSWKEKRVRELGKKIEKIGRLIVLNESNKKDLKKLFSNNKNKIEKIYNPFDIEKIEKLSLEKSLLTNKEKELIEDKYFLACCRLDKLKDIDTLIESYKILKEKYIIEEKLYIIGDGEERERLENLVKKYNLEKDIIFLGMQKNPYVWMRNAKFFIHSSYYEAFGLVLVEALITNGMVISSDCPVGPREILEDGKYGILFPVGDKEKLVEKIYMILFDKNIVEKYRKESRKRIEDFSKDRIKERILRELK